MIKKELLLASWLEKLQKKWDNEEYYYDVEEATKVFKFVSKLTNDRGASRQFELLEFQFEIITEILCVKRRSDGKRKHREAHINIPRKNGKSFLAAIIVVYLFFCQRHIFGALFILTANTTKQAGELYATVEHFIKTNKTLRRYCKITSSNYDYNKAGTNVEITYYATVSNSVSSKSPLKNKVTSETASTHNGTPTKTEYIVVSTPVKATIKKVDLTDSKITLEDAVFELHRVVNGKDTVVATATTDDKGIATFDGLDAQDTTYYIVETQAPSGYKIDGIEHHLSGATANEPTINTVKDSKTKITTITTTYTFTDFGDKGITTITNTKLSALPSTGGIGTTIFTIAGCVIMIAAAGLFFASRKKSDNK